MKLVASAAARLDPQLDQQEHDSDEQDGHAAQHGEGTDDHDDNEVSGAFSFSPKALTTDVPRSFSFGARGSLPLPAARAVVVIGQGQVVTAIVLRALGWHVELAANVAEAGRIAQAIDATALFVRISQSHLRSLRRPRLPDACVVAIVDSAEDTPLPGFDATIAVDDVDTLAAYVRSVAPTARVIAVAR